MWPLADLQTERVSRELRTLAVVVHTLATVTGLPVLLNAVINEIGEMLDSAHGVSVFLWDASSERLRPHAAFGYDFEIFKEISLRKGESLPGNVFVNGKTSLVSTPDKVTGLIQDLTASNCSLWQRSSFIKSLPQSAMGVPIVAGGHIYGVLLFESFTYSAIYTQQDFSFAQLIAELISMAVERFRLAARENSQRGNSTAVDLEFEVFEAISHELRMPLTAIKGYATALMLDEVDWSLAKRQEFLQLIDDECNDMEELLSNLLKSAVIDSNSFVLDPKPLRLTRIAQESAAEMKRRTQQHRMIVDFPVDFPVMQADEHWIKQVFLNLLDNAIKFSPEGGLIVIRGEVRPTDIIISISDQGIGISPEDMIPLFDKYVRAISPTGAQIPGTGLGLPLTRTIVEAHGGHIWARSEVGEGTTLSFSLPLPHNRNN